MKGILKWILIFAAVYTGTNLPLSAQNTYNVVFYNVENLFDTRDDSLTTDEEFTPLNERHWTRERFDNKIKMLYKALISAGSGQFPDIIGLAEVENLWVLEQLISKTPFSKVPYGIIHKDSPDPRGIDVALLYRKDRIKPIDYEHITVSGEGKYKFKSRDILHFTAELGKEQIHFFVNHWPSRSGGYIETKEKRDITARILRKYIDSLLVKNPSTNIILMGDFNATPKEKCFTSILKALPYPGNKNPSCLVNLSTLWTKNAEGTIRNGGQWEVFDQMICSNNMLSNNVVKIEIEQSGICNFEFLLEPDLTYLGKKPFRTYLGPKYHGGTSDHLPVKVCISEK
ncbi:MAG: endonuclease [Mariniphaga sp.]|nr:endonuclease [Mariniphaga sp.]